jgi:hypothetical protein
MHYSIRNTFSVNFQLGMLFYENMYMYAPSKLYYIGIDIVSVLARSEVTIKGTREKPTSHALTI